MQPSVPRFVIAFVALAACLGCSRGSTGSSSSPAPSASAKPKAARVRQVSPGDAPADLARSQVSISVIKDKDSANPVVAKLALADGAVALTGAAPSARLSIDIDSLDTGIPIRNERVRNLFFETTGLGWDTAELTVPALPAEVVAALKTRRAVEKAALDGQLKVHGKTAKVPLVVDARYADDGRLSVKTTVPAEVRISDFSLGDNLRRLSSVCMHDSIDDLVKVEVALEFAPPP